MMTREQAVNFLRYRPAEFGRMLGFTKLGRIHNGWIKKMAYGREDYTLQGHRNSYKTTCLSIALALIIILLPNKRTLFMRKTDDDVKEIIKQVKNILTDKRTAYLVSIIYGVQLKLTVDNATEINTNLTTDIKGTSQLVGLGAGSSITGKHYDFIFTDDIVNLKDRLSRAEREKTKQIYQELINVKGHGRIFNTGTPWHKEDAFSLMPEPEKWDITKTGIFSPEEIQEIKDQLSPSLFAANYELRHIAAEDVIFENAITGAEPDKIKNANFCHIDAAYGGEDGTAFTCMRRRGGRIYGYGRRWDAHVDTVLDFCVSRAGELMCGPIHNEKNGDKGYLSREIANTYGYPAYPYTEKENKYVKISTFLRKWWENIYWLPGTDATYLDEIMDYTEDAEHDDSPDSAASVCRILDRQSGEDYTSPFRAI